LLDFLYGQAVGARRRWYERHPQARRRLAHPVISIGNMSVGGTAKTPMVAQLARWLVERGERPAILSRGYGRRLRADGVVVVSDGVQSRADLDHAGDEPLMLARAVPAAVVAVGEDRFLAGVLAERRLGATVHLLDDGFQHVQLARDLDVLMTTPGEVAGGRVLPFGRLRESAGATARAHVVVVLDTDLAGARSEAWALGISQAVAARRMLAGAGVAGAISASGAGSAEGAVVAVAGIAQPQQFFQLLRDSGYSIAETIAFTDHHRYDREDADRVAGSVRHAGARGVVTTEKDLVRWEVLAPLPFACEAVPLRLEIEGWDLLTASIEQALMRRREVA